MKSKIIILSILIFSCSSKTKNFLPIESNKVLSNKCLWAKGVIKEKEFNSNSEETSLYYCCPNRDIDNKKIRPICVGSKFLIYK